MAQPNYFRWTSTGRKAEFLPFSEWKLKAITHMRCSVRETAYHLSRLEAAEHEENEEYSRSKELYRQACDTLLTFDPDAKQFINQTYQPKTYICIG